MAWAGEGNGKPSCLGGAEWVVVPGGRELKRQPPAKVDRLALLLVSALVPLEKPCPLRFCRNRA